MGRTRDRPDSFLRGCESGKQPLVHLTFARRLFAFIYVVCRPFGTSANILSDELAYSARLTNDEHPIKVFKD